MHKFWGGETLETNLKSAEEMVNDVFIHFIIHLLIHSTRTITLSCVAIALLFHSHSWCTYSQVI